MISGLGNPPNYADLFIDLLEYFKQFQNLKFAIKMSSNVVEQKLECVI